MYASYPRIPGHEFSAEIVEIGDNDQGLAPGMLVTGNPYYNCGHCYSCARGFVNCCTSNQTLGAQRDGIFREYFAMPVERIYSGKGLDAQVLAAIEPFCISYHGVQRARVQSGEHVLVIGAGPIGLMALLAAKLKGAEVTIADITQPRLDKALELGADHIINSGVQDFDEACKELTGGNGFDAAFECAGRPNTFLNCMEAVAFRGRVVMIGIGKQNLDFAYAMIQTKELDIFGSRNALKNDFLELIDHVDQGRVDLSKLITRVADIDEAPEAFREASEEPEKVIKTLVAFNE
ncbi:zinc-binding dehydrogenase [Propionimicrobium sp. PCR01-08-3]|uniref:zinc-binding dehydrogenase n=1 Tax=Propionimicrobium sp. PCR01-08-3 TaxID=3052086 RepID=UPI00255CD04B|nr:zinc-binding dehydrogenase [Propionimicrobium sp. PCR01-08-3]WIY84272.1 zinc-binding dehydrogenase [Propionimicrobium sp. PCR01-08-3]